MKNFKKVLALVLVVATLFSFVAMANAKTLEDYSDAAEVNYEEAVDVLSALGIINGYDGAFHPADNIDRDEMAKMVACLRNAGEIDPALYASANKFADCKGSWAEGYIAYCAQLGIVAGRNASTFDPDGKVTGVEVLKMLLCTLGYDAKEQGYVGANWQVNVLRDARKSDLLAGLEGMKVYEAATRDQAAQMFLNALKAEMVVGYVSENIVKLSNSLYLFGDTNISLTDALQDGWEVTYCNAIISLTPLYEIFADVEMEASKDCFGRPATWWTIRNKHGKVILSKTYAAEADFTFTDNVRLDQELGEIFTHRNAPVNVYTFVNGQYQTVDNTLRLASDVTGNGLLTEVFINDDVVYVVVIETFIGQVETVSYKTGRVTLTNGLRFSCPIEVDEEDYVMYHVCAGDSNGFNFDDQEFAGNHDDVIAAEYANGTDVNIHDVWVVEPTVETVVYSAFGRLDIVGRIEDSYFMTDSEKFEYAYNFISDLEHETVDLNDLIQVTGHNQGWNGVMDEENVYDIFVNEHGYVLYYEVHDFVEDYQYGYIVENSHDSYEKGVIDTVVNTEFFFDVVDFDARLNNNVEATRAAWRDTVKDIHVDEDEDYYVVPGTLACYFENEDGLVELEQVGTEVEEGWVQPRDARIHGATTEDGRQIYADSETQYMVRTYNWATGEYNYDVYIGYDNLPSTLLGYKWVNDGTDADDSFYFNTLQYLTGVGIDDDAHDDIATHVFIDAMYAGTSEFFYLLEEVSRDSQTLLYPFINDFRIYTALVDGEVVNVAIADDAADWVEEMLRAPGTPGEHRLYRARMQAIDVKTMNDLPIYAAMQLQPVANWSIVSVNNSLVTIDRLRDALSDEHGHIQIAKDAAINVISPVFRDDHWTTVEDDEIDYDVFEGENRDKEFNKFFTEDDWIIEEMQISFTSETIRGYNGSFEEITELWIVLEPAR